MKNKIKSKSKMTDNKCSICYESEIDWNCSQCIYGMCIQCFEKIRDQYGCCSYCKKEIIDYMNELTIQIQSYNMNEYELSFNHTAWAQLLFKSYVQD